MFTSAHREGEEQPVFHRKLKGLPSEKAGCEPLKGWSVRPENEGELL